MPRAYGPKNGERSGHAMKQSPSTKERMKRQRKQKGNQSSAEPVAVPQREQTLTRPNWGRKTGTIVT
jgi:hypothetical protein